MTRAVSQFFDFLRRTAAVAARGNCGGAVKLSAAGSSGLRHEGSSLSSFPLAASSRLFQRKLRKSFRRDFKGACHG